MTGSGSTDCKLTQDKITNDRHHERQKKIINKIQRFLTRNESTYSRVYEKIAGGHEWTFY